MKIAILGTGMVGQAIAGKMSSLRHTVYMGTRNAEETKLRQDVNRRTGISFAEWHKNYPDVEVVNYENLPSNSGLFVNAASGYASLEALKKVGREKFKNKTLLDISNPLDFSGGMPPSLFVCNTDSLAEQIQREFPDSKVVKSLNTMNCLIMMNPSLIPGDHSVFLSGNDSDAKAEVRSLLNSVGWKDSNIIDLGDITTARSAEMILPIWLRLRSAFNSADFNFHIVRK